MACKLLAVVLISILLISCAPIVTDTFPWPTPAGTTDLKCDTIGEYWSTSRDNSLAMCVPAGEFTMGASDSDPDAGPDEKPAHKVNLDAFWIDRTEVTNAMFARCVSQGGCDPRPERRGTTGVASLKHLNYYYDAEFANYPVLTYEAKDAADYCEWAGRRLPTEAEWEKAARGTDARQFPWGEGKECTRGSFFGCTEDTTTVDGPMAGASPYGALNMAGNVWEWVADQYASDYYANSPSTNPTGPAQGQGNVRRGGGWRSLTRDLRVTARESGVAQHYMDGQMGFRCAMSDRPQ